MPTSPMTEPRGQLRWRDDHYEARIRYADGKRPWIRLPGYKENQEEAARAHAKRLAKRAKNEGSDLLTRPMAARGKSHLSRAPTTPNV
jgi:hypothetical protein